MIGARDFLARLRGGCHAPEPASDYGNYHISIAASYRALAGIDVLVAGCNTGEECRRFIERGAHSVTGVDVVDDVGASYSDPRVAYHRMSIEALELRDAQFDLVYCFATMEHVSRIALAFSELVRVTRPGGVVYCVAAPLWNSKHGHHKADIFGRFPWIHLRLTRDEILAWCEQNGVVEHAGLPIDVHVDYMLNPEYFNMTRASRYIEACSALDRVDVLVHSLMFDAGDELTDEIASSLGAQGYSRQELLASVHTFIARRR